MTRTVSSDRSLRRASERHVRPASSNISRENFEKAPWVLGSSQTSSGTEAAPLRMKWIEPHRLMVR